MPQNHPEKNEITMTADQIKSAFQKGLCRFGSHTHTHANLSELSDEKLKNELADSKKLLEGLLQTQIVDLALPHGDYNQKVLEYAKQIGYKYIYTLEPHVNPKILYPGKVGRFSMSPDIWPIEFKLTCAGAYAWLHPWRRSINWVRKQLFS